LVKPLKVYANTPEINIGISSTEKGDMIIKAIEKEFKDQKLLHLDGVSVEGNGWWFNLRKSNTEPLVRLRAEAGSEEKLDEIKDRVMKIIEKNK
ncbi:MAG: phosphomannomutase/phosphoglucomutase, partial [Nanoarchaeota archaeon]|nr:phosphomannomutase/phosphoglucomutase [Nanoarchaeota archaeon]